jgi:hypothetical protein
MRRALDLAPANAGFMRWMSDLAKRRGDIKEAFDWSDRALAIQPGDSRHYDHRARLLLSQGDLPAGDASMR